MFKKALIVLYWVVFIAIVLWVVMSFMNVNYINVTNAELARWNLFEIIYQLSEEGV